MDHPAHDDGEADWQRLQRYANADDQRAFTELVEAHVGLVYAAALRQVRSPELAEEVTQAVFILLAGKAASIGRDTVLPAWLHRSAFYVARNTVKQAARRRRHERRAAAAVVEAFGDGGRPAGPTWQRLSPALDAGVAGLREADRQAIVLRFFQRQTLAEVGRTLGISEDAAQMRVSRAVAKLRAFFVRAGVTLDTCSLANVIWVNTAARPVPGGMTAHVVRGVRVAGAFPSVAAATADTAARAMGWARAGFVTAAAAAVLLAVGGTVFAVQSVVLHGPRSPRPVVVAVHD